MPPALIQHLQRSPYVSQRSASVRTASQCPFVWSAATHRGDATRMSSTGSDASRQLWRQLDATYHRALDGGDVFRTETDDKVFTDPVLNAGFVLRVAAALNSKPKPKPATNDGRYRQ